MARRLVVLWLLAALALCTASWLPRVAVVEGSGVHCLDVAFDGGSADLFICKWR